MNPFNLLAANAAQELIRWGLILLVGLPVAFSNDTTDLMDDMNIKYEFVENLGQAGRYVFDSDMIQFDQSMYTRGQAIRGVAAHEIVHKARHEMGFHYHTEAERRLEEAVATYATNEVSRLLGFGEAHIDPKYTLRKVFKVNNLGPKDLTEVELAEVRFEVSRTIDFIKAKYLSRESDDG